jgi:formylglycine-generating enzyme required for sulfatase activity
VRRIPSGVHWQGIGEVDRWGLDDLVTPLHQVELTTDHWLSTYEATAGCYHRCAWEGACTEPRWNPHPEVAPEHYLEAYGGLRRDYWLAETHADLPIVDLTRRAAEEYCHWLGGRLPTDVEWEKAARGSSGRRLPWEPDPPHPPRPGELGEGIREDRCRFVHSWRASGRGGTCPGSPDFVVPVSSFPEGAGPYGHLNLLGNVVEWVADSAVPYDVDPEMPYRVNPPPARVPGAGAILRGFPNHFGFDRVLEDPVPTLANAYPIGVRCAFDRQPEPLFSSP